MWDYTSKVMDHFLNPRNVGEIENPDAVAEVGNITCGDALKLYLKLDDSGRISDVKFKTFGCASAIASSSALTELVKGMTLDEAAKVTNKDIVKLLGSLPEEKMHCSVMGMEALQAAIADYKARHGESYQKIEENPEDHEGRIVCKCFGVTDTKIRRVARPGAHAAHVSTRSRKFSTASGKSTKPNPRTPPKKWTTSTPSPLSRRSSKSSPSSTAKSVRSSNTTAAILSSSTFRAIRRSSASKVTAQPAWRQK